MIPRPDARNLAAPAVSRRSVLSRRAPSIFVAVLAACSAAPPRPAEPPPPVAAAPREPPPDPCLGQPGEVLFRAVPEVDATCAADDLRACTATLPITVQNCQPAPAILERIELSNERGLAMTVDFDHERLAHGERLERPVRVSAGQYRITATVRFAEAEAPRRTATLDARVTNTALDAARSACRECQGDWGQMGLAGVLGCNCRPRDAGKECRDGDACEGLCLFHHTEIVQKPEPVRCGPHGCTARLGLGVAVGRCSERRYVFSCTSIVPRGASREPAYTLPWHVPTVCID